MNAASELFARSSTRERLINSGGKLSDLDFSNLSKRMTVAAFKKRIISRLKMEPLDAVLAEVRRLPPRQAVSPLIAGLFNADGYVKWHAVSALGAVMTLLAKEDMEAARNIMRRLMWSLNDESGNIGWGVPEAMAEIMANHDGLAEEYAHILIAYMREDGSYLKLTPLQRGLMWGIGRLAEARRDLLEKWEAPAYLLPYLDSEDPEVRGLAARALGILQVEGAKGKLAVLKNDSSGVLLYDKGKFETRIVGDLAREALASISGISRTQDKKDLAFFNPDDRIL